MKSITATCMMVMLLFSVLSAQDVPRVISYQGVLTDMSGKPKNGSFDITFRLFTGSSGGSALWESTKNLEVKGGVFFTLLGESPALPEINTQAWLEVEEGGMPFPRVPLGAAIYALNIPNSSVSTAKIRDKAVTEDKIGDLAVTTGKIGFKTVTHSRMADNSISAAQLNDGAVTGKKISQMSASDGQILQWSSTNATWAPQTVSGVPVGTIIAYAGDSSFPQDWELCNGQKKNISDPNYQKLYSVIRNYWGGDATTFRLPQLQGMFLRGVDPNSQVNAEASARTKMYPSDANGNSGANVGTYEADALRNHTHVITRGTGGGDGGSNNFASFSHQPPDRSGSSGGVNEGAVSSTMETRPKNAAVHWLIKVR